LYPSPPPHKPLGIAALVAAVNLPHIHWQFGAAALVVAVGVYRLRAGQQICFSFLGV
jgi:hypothetical protein